MSTGLKGFILKAMSRKTDSSQRSDSSSSRQKAYLGIQRMIVSGELQSGGTVSEYSLAKKLGVSRTPVREALGRLAAEGLLEQNPNRRPVVVMLTRQDIIELYELREALEVYAVGKTARQTTRSADLTRLQSLTDSIGVLSEELDRSGKSTLGPEQMQRFVAHDLGFHTLLIRMAANTRILKIVNETRLLIRIFAIRRQGHGKLLLEKIHRQHGEVLRAVVNHEPARAMRQISEHIQTSLQERLEEYDHWEVERSLSEGPPFP